MKTLTDCRQGDTVTISNVTGSGAIKKRLLEMGFMKGTTVEIVKYAPLKDPMELLVKNFHVSIRISEADKISVEPSN